MIQDKVKFNMMHQDKVKVKVTQNQTESNLISSWLGTPVTPDLIAIIINILGDSLALPAVVWHVRQDSTQFM